MYFFIKPNISIMLAVGWLLLTTFLLVIPGNDLPKTSLVNIPYFDKLVHIGLFAVLSMLFVSAIILPDQKKLIIIALMAILYGIIMEFVQLYLVANRNFDVKDIVADSIGSIAGVVLCTLLRKKPV